MHAYVTYKRPLQIRAEEKQEKSHRAYLLGATQVKLSWSCNRSCYLQCLGNSARLPERGTYLSYVRLGKFPEWETRYKANRHYFLQA